MALARALDVSFDALVSLKLEQEITPAVVPETPLLQKFPFQMFGISAKDLNELIADHPREMGTLVGVLTEFGKTYDLRAEHFYHTALRTYQILHRNFFPDLEKAVSRFRNHLGWPENHCPRFEELWSLVRERYGYRPYDPGPDDSLETMRSVMFHRKGELYMNAALTPQQKAFVVAREIGYQELGITERAYNAPSLEVGSFEQVINNFHAAYFADSLMVPMARLRLELESLFRQDQWDPNRFAGLFKVFHITPEMLLYRLSAVLPKTMGLPNILLLKFTRARRVMAINPEGQEQENTEGSQSGSRRRGTRRKSDIKVQLSKQLNMSRIPLPDGMNANEHFCRRWRPLQILDDLERQGESPLVIGAQRSRFTDAEDELFCISMAYPDSMNPREIAAMSIGFQMDEAFRKQVRFHGDPAIQLTLLGQTCERCPLSLEECDERVAPPHIYEAEQVKEAHRKHLARLLDQF